MSCMWSAGVRTKAAEMHHGSPTQPLNRSRSKLVEPALSWIFGFGHRTSWRPQTFPVGSIFLCLIPTQVDKINEFPSGAGIAVKANNQCIKVIKIDMQSGY